MHWIITTFILLISITSVDLAAAKPKARVNAILKEAAVLTINGQQLMLRLNAKSPGGYQLIEIAEDYVVLARDGQQYQVKLGAAVGAYQANPTTQVRIPKTNGMYYVEGRINGTSVQFLVDTGATTVAINSLVAARMGLDYRNIGTQSIASTASGQVPTWRVNLSNVSIGGITLSNVDAVVIEGSYPRSVLLGMSFLGRLKMQDNGLLLTLEQSL